ncbi:MAG: hypothetical protein KGY99_00365 [Phycisphaerae bacterium]|nr:hypothetical protein [Phycisphaerae bacterium]
MRRTGLFAIALLAAATLLACGCNGAWSDERYDLSRRPELRRGDVVYWSTVRESVMQFKTTAGRTVRDHHERTTGQVSQTVLDIGADGRASRLRLRAASITRDVYATRPREQAFADTVRLGIVFGRADRSNGAYRCDPSTLVSPDTPTLSAAQIALIKDVMLGRTWLQARPAHRAALMPKRSLAVGEAWTPPAEGLKAWTKAAAPTGGAPWTVREAQFTLEAVRDGVAEVRGRMTLQTEAAGRPIDATATRRWLIDTRTGIWLDESAKVEARTRIEGFRRVHRITSRKSVRFRRGDGEPPKPLPGGLHAVGWEAAGADTNRYRDARAGFSMDIPAAFAPSDTDGGPAAVAFRADDGAHLQIRQQRAPRPVEPDRRLTQMAERLQTAYSEFEPNPQQSLMLAGGVPAALLTGTFRRDGRDHVLVALVAVDRRRVVAVTAAAPHRANRRKQLERIVRTLRLTMPAADTTTGAR